MQVHLTTRSSNGKTGPIPVTTSPSCTCPAACSLRKQEDGKASPCYAGTGPLALHWRRTDEGRNTIDWGQLCEAVKAFPDGQVWRHNQAGDLPHKGERIDRRLLQDLTEANRGRRGFTYTHHDLDIEENREAIREANANGFTVNLSADSLEDADRKADFDIGPVVAILPSTATENTVTPQGRPVILCLAVTHGLSCKECAVCAVANRKTIIGFPAHGSGKKYVDKIFGE